MNNGVRIYELEDYEGQIGSDDYLATDDGITTTKISASAFLSVINAYPRAGQTPLSATWLSATSGGVALTPASDRIYILMANSGEYTANTMFRWNGTSYVPLTSNDEVDGGVTDSYPISGATPLSAGWLSETSGGTALTPKANEIYILMSSSGTYTANTMFRWNGTAYEPLTSGGGGSGTSVPTANTVAEFDSTAHMNSTDMTEQEVSDFVDGLNPSGFDIVTNVTDKVTFSKPVSTNYTYFYKVGAVIFYQIQFAENIASGTTVATMDSSLGTSKQFWALVGYSNGGNNYKRVSVSGTNITVVGAISAYDFVSGFFIPNAV